MVGRHYTIIVVSPERTRARKFRLSDRFVPYALIVLAALFLGSFGIALHLYHQTVRISTLKSENSQLKADLENSQVLTQKLTRKLSSLTNLSNRLKIMAGLPQNKKRPLGPGVGGFSLQRGGSDPSRLQQLDTRAEALQHKLTWLHTYFQDRTLSPSMLPTEGYISSTFGMRRNPFTNRPDFHEGIDITNQQGTPVMAPATGTVIFAGYRGTLGQTIEMQHDGRISTVYGHLSQIAVKQGQRVNRGELIGLMGNTGMSTGPHLHYEIRIDKQPVNPKTYLDSFSS